MLALNGRSLMWGAALTVSAACAAAHAEDAVILQSNQKGYAAGAPLRDGQSLTLSRGADATLLFRSGRIVRVKGPFDGRLDVLQPPGAASGVVGLVRALQSRGVDASVLGATRGVHPTSKSGSEPGVGVTTNRSSTYCLGAHDAVWLERPQAGEGAVRLRRGDVGRQILFESGATRAPWPQDVAIEDGDRFELVDEARRAAAVVVFRRLPETPTTPAWVAAGSLAGCKDQVAPALREIVAAINAAPGL